MGDNVTAPFPLLHVDLNLDPTSPTHDFSFPNHHHQFLSSRYSTSSCSHELGVVSHELFPPPEPHHLQRVSFDDELLLGQGGTHDHPFGEDETRGKSRVGDGDHNYSRDHDLGHLPEYCSVKWVSSKMRIMKKMSNMEKPLSAVQNFGSVPKLASTVPPWVPDVLENDSSSSANSHRSVSSRTESHNNNNNNNYPIIRVCADCNTTKTPLWRSGPTGPKTLCNACGIRQRKARRAMAAAAAAANGEVPPQQNLAPTKEQQKKKKSMKKKRLSSSDNDNENDSSYDPQPKKKPKTLLLPPAGSRDLCFEEFVMKLSEWTSGFRGVFPQDEKEAAILLMALSYGLVRSNNIS
ncbi:hypothetical protein MLD38_015363 [Melastoma candidum]|uniref:Uncharacterized protein n=1 Tax=Melastoma candidum TaxID=119954 RepID=A0ACB9RFW0_9MYRT|nr:hypothetical protein MLD38_015363 [Melastoma candidum]